MSISVSYVESEARDLDRESVSPVFVESVLQLCKAARLILRLPHAPLCESQLAGDQRAPLGPCSCFKREITTLVAL